MIIDRHSHRLAVASTSAIVSKQGNLHALTARSGTFLQLKPASPIRSCLASIGSRFKCATRIVVNLAFCIFYSARSAKFCYIVICVSRPIVTQFARNKAAFTCMQEKFGAWRDLVLSLVADYTWRTACQDVIP